jgi:recombinational DNA repair protein (RecF pathway)
VKKNISLRFCNRQANGRCTLCDDCTEPGELEFFDKDSGGLVCLSCACKFAPELITVADAAYRAHSARCEGRRSGQPVKVDA